MARKTYRCYVNIDYLAKTDTGRRKIWRTDAVPTYVCSFTPAYFIWEKATRHNGYNAYTGYVHTNAVTFIDTPGV
jgi:hypothetical protein